jgi:hypothetical protein
MTRTRANSGQAAKRPTAPTPGASLPLDASVLSIVANLGGHDLNGLRRRWRAHLGGEAPAHLPRWLLIRVLAYRLQSDAFGGLDKSIRRILRTGKEDGAGAPFDRRAPQTREGVSLKVGALLVREWKGRLERVMILEEGFAWNGQTFGSLSQIAKAMTGTTWNGHRFFGLRQGKTSAADVGTDRRNSRNRTAASIPKSGRCGQRPNGGTYVAPELSQPTPGHLLDKDYLTSTGETVPRPGVPQSLGETPFDRNIRQQNDRIDNSICSGC